MRPDAGQVCWTGLTPPGGLVEVLAVAGAWVQVRHVLDHPYGYGRGTVGWYTREDLQPCAWPEEDDAC